MDADLVLVLAGLGLLVTRPGRTLRSFGALVAVTGVVLAATSRPDAVAEERPMPSIVRDGVGLG